MSNVLDWRDDGETPRCEMLLASGERVAITLSAGGIQIDQLGWDGRAHTCLFQGNLEITTGICMGLLAGKLPESTTPLHVLAAAVSGMPSAAAVREAFTKAARGLPDRQMSGAIPRAIVIAMLLCALALAGRVAYQVVVQAPG
jgi:hypothetical protein